MALNFKVKNVIHSIRVKFIPALLPGAKRRYYLKPAMKQVLDIHDIAARAAAYNMTTPPEIIEEGFNAAMELMFYLAADGYGIKTKLFNLKIRFPGEYAGGETSLPEGIFPVARFQPSRLFRNYIRDHVKLIFDGKAESAGYIAEAKDEASGLVNERATLGRLLTIRGIALKVRSDALHEEEAGVFFADESGESIKAELIAVNEPRTLKVMVPPSLKPGESYRLLIATQSPLKARVYLLKAMREVRSSFTLIAHA